MIRSKKIFLNILILTVSLLFATRDMPKFTDDINYLNYLQFADLHIANLFESIKVSIFNIIPKEGLWLSITYFFSLFFDKITGLRIIIFLSSFLFLRFFLKLNNYNILNTITLIINPQFVTNYVLHIRQGVAMSVYYGGKYYFKIALIAFLAVLVHVSFLIFIFFDILEKVLNKLKFSFKQKIVINLIISFLTAVSTSLYFSFFSDDKRVLYEKFTSDTSGLGFVFWIVIFVLFVYDSRKVSQQYQINYIMSIFGISFYIFSYYTNSFGARVFESFLPIVILSLSALQKQRQILIYFMLLLYSLLQWYFRGGINF